MILTIEDRFEINDLLANYCFSLDDLILGQAYQLYFTIIRRIDFMALVSGPKGNPQEFIQFLKGFSENVVSWQHIAISTNTLEVDRYLHQVKDCCSSYNSNKYT